MNTSSACRVCRVCRVCKVVQSLVLQPNTAVGRVVRASQGIVLGVQGCRARRRVDAQILKASRNGELFFHANPETACTPCTPYTHQIKVLIYKGFWCVGFVLGIGFLCWVDVLLGAW